MVRDRVSISAGRHFVSGNVLCFHSGVYSIHYTVAGMRLPNGRKCMSVAYYDGCIAPAIHHVVFAHTIEQLRQQLKGGGGGGGELGHSVLRQEG